jgi:serine/threonine protein kinase
VGSGKFGDVHICRHKTTGTLYALKKIFKSTIIEYGMIEQFTRELKIHYKLSNTHPNITKLYAHFEDEYHLFLLMEYMEDGTLM